MDTTVINIRTEIVVKEEAKKVAYKLGMSLSTVINVLLKQFVRMHGLTVNTEEYPNAYFAKKLEESDNDIKTNKVSPSFDNSKDAIEWLNK